jgi:glycosyltransferase involved in cell wall biosynthesis
MVYAETKPLSFESGLPYLMAIHDLQHRLQPEFPEVSANGEWESREYYLRNCSRYATLLMADSEVGKEDILNIYGSYGISPDRIKVLPYLPAPYVQNEILPIERRRVRQSYNLPERYFFYPAQFWPHKNHLRIVRALAALREEHGIQAFIVFCGSHNDPIREQTFNEVMRSASDLGLADQVRYLGFVPSVDMSALYAEAVALVMPTFFGPTNIPVLEAWALQCPVLTSDIRGLREQAGCAALLVNPRSVESLAYGLYRLWTEDSLRKNLIAEGTARLSAYGPEDFQQRFMDILEEAKCRVKSGKIVHIPAAKGTRHH